MSAADKRAEFPPRRREAGDPFKAGPLALRGESPSEHGVAQGPARARQLTRRQETETRFAVPLIDGAFRMSALCGRRPGASECRAAQRARSRGVVIGVTAILLGIAPSAASAADSRSP